MLVTKCSNSWNTLWEIGDRGVENVNNENKLFWMLKILMFSLLAEIHYLFFSILRTAVINHSSSWEMPFLIFLEKNMRKGV